MVDEDADAPVGAGDRESREPSVEDFVSLCRHLNEEGADYLVLGGFAMRAAGYDRRTMDVDLLIDLDSDNEARVFRALASLPDQAVLELEPGEIARYSVVRVADEIVVDLMGSAGGIDYPAAADQIETRDIDGVRIPFASPRLLWKTKAHTHREKDRADLAFLKALFASRGEQPPDAAS